MRSGPLNLTVNNTDGVELGTVIRRHDADYYSGAIFFSGTFGGGSASLHCSIDGGETIFPVLDISGSAVSASADGYFNFVFYGDGNTNPADENINLYVVVDGATDPVISCTLFDNR